MFRLGDPIDLATQGFLTGSPLSISIQGFLEPVTARIADLILSGSAPTITVIGGLTTFFYPADGGLFLSGAALVTTKIGGIVTPTIPGLGGLELGGLATTVTLINGQLIVDYQPVSGASVFGGEASVVTKIGGQVSAVHVGHGLILLSGSAKQEFVKFLKDIFPPQPPLPGPAPTAPITVPSYVVVQNPITQFQKNDISSQLFEIGGEQMHLFELELFGSRDFEFVIVIRPWSIAVDFALETWISDTPLGKPIAPKVNITFRKMTFFYIKEETLEIWQDEIRIFHSVIDLRNGKDFFFHVDNLENRKINKYALKVETFVYNQTIFDSDTTIFDLLGNSETVFDLVGEPRPVIRITEK